MLYNAEYREKTYGISYADWHIINFLMMVVQNAETWCSISKPNLLLILTYTWMFLLGGVEQYFYYLYFINATVNIFTVCIICYYSLRMFYFFLHI